MVGYLSNKMEYLGAQAVASASPARVSGTCFLDFWEGSFSALQVKRG